MSYTQLISRETLGTFLLPLTTYDDLHVLDSGPDLVASTKGMGKFGGWTGSLHGSPCCGCSCMARTEGSCSYYGTRGRQRWLFVWIIPKNNPLAQVIDGCSLWFKGSLTSPSHFFFPCEYRSTGGFTIEYSFACRDFKLVRDVVLVLFPTAVIVVRLVYILYGMFCLDWLTELLFYGAGS
jgi:hypothetical protein